MTNHIINFYVVTIIKVHIDLLAFFLSNSFPPTYCICTHTRMDTHTCTLTHTQMHARTGSHRPTHAHNQTDRNTHSPTLGPHSNSALQKIEPNSEIATFFLPAVGPDSHVIIAGLGGVQQVAEDLGI